MSRFAIISMPLEPGHHNAAAVLAASLEARGHEVCFVGVAEDQTAIERRGFVYLPVTGPRSPARSEAGEGAGSPRTAARRPWGSRASRARGLWDHYMLRRGLLVGLARATATLREFDGIVVDGLLLGAALTVARTGRPTVMLHTTFSPYNPAMPPFWTAHSPAGSGAARFLPWLCERWMRLRTALVALFQPRLPGTPGGRFRILGALPRWQALVESFPALIACPRALDFPLPDLPSERHGPPLVDLRRAEEPFDWSVMPASCTGGVVLVSMGTQHWLMREPLRFFAVVAAAAADMADRFFVIVAGDLAPVLAQAHRRANLLVLREGPQLQLLSRAAVMVTHGGLNTVKECVMMGVPMICFPIERDQPGNAARVTWHGLGLRGDYRAVTGPELADMVRQVAEGGQFRAAVERMRVAFRAHGDDAAARLVEEAIGPRWGDVAPDGARAAP